MTRRYADQAIMTLAIPATVPVASRGHPARRTPGDSGVVAMTLVVEARPDEPHRPFRFRPARPAEAPRVDPTERSRAALSSGRGTGAEGDGVPWMRAVDGSSSGFLAGAIAQTWSGVRLHNPQHQAAARMYRAADLLGLPAGAPARRDTRI